VFSHRAQRSHCLDSKTGCTYWVFDAGVGTRTAISIGEFGPPRRVAAPPPAPRRHKTAGSKKSKHQQFTLAHLDVL